jgi:hypothetical protein
MRVECFQVKRLTIHKAGSATIRPCSLNAKITRTRLYIKKTACIGLKENENVNCQRKTESETRNSSQPHNFGSIFHTFVFIFGTFILPLALQS